MGVVEQLAALLRKDFLETSRRWHELAALLVVSVVIGVAVAYIVSGPSSPLASGLDAGIVVAAGHVVVFFIVALAAGFLAVLREAEKGTLDGIRASPVAPEAVFVSKLVYTYVLVALLSLSYAAAVAFFGSFSGAVSPLYLAATLSMSLYFAAASALTSFMIVYSESRSLLAMVVLAGLLLPYLQGAARTLARAAVGAAVEARVAEGLAAAAAFAAIATLLSRPLAEI